MTFQIADFILPLASEASVIAASVEQSTPPLYQRGTDLCLDSLAYRWVL